MEKKQDTVKLDKKTYDDLMSIKKDVEHLKRGEMPPEDYEAEDKKFVRVSFVEKKPVIGWEKPLITKVKRGEQVDYIKVIVKGKEEDEVIEMKYLDFVRGVEREQEECEVVGIKQKVHKEFQGYTTKKYVEGYRTINTGIRVPVKIETLEEVYTVKLPNGETLAINTEYLN